MIAQTQITQARQVDLLRLVEPDTALSRIANTHGGEYAGPCPFCGGADRFHVVPEAGKWYCRQCTPRGGDAIDYVQRREQVAFQAAVDLLAGNATWAPSMQMRARSNVQPIVLPNWTQPAWQQAAQALVQAAEAGLADDVAGGAARTYLVDRGLQPATWQAWRLGFHLAWQPVRREGSRSMSTFSATPW